MNHPALEPFRRVTQGTEYENQIWLVGGCVRDALLKRPLKNDFDAVLQGSAIELAHFLFEKGVSHIKPVEYPRFGTALVRIGDINLELVTARKENYAEESRKPTIEPASLEEDARRRDFTVNALMQNLHTGELYDPLGSGFQDLEKRVLRTPLDPAETFHEDPLRMLRAVRFRWQLEFEPAPGLFEAIKASRERLKIISQERIRDEWVKMLGLPHAVECMRDLMDLGLLEIFAPEFCAMIGVEQGRYHHLDVWDHTLLVLQKVGHDDLILSLGALLHDVAKPATRTVDDQGNTRFFSHESLGAEMTEAMLRRLKFSGEEAEAVALLVKNHMRMGSAPKLSDSAIRRLIRDLDEQLPRLLDLVQADVASLKPGMKVMDLDAIRTRIAEVRQVTPAKVLESPLSGDEIMDLLSLEPGPKVGEYKLMLTEKVLDGTLSPDDKAEARRVLLQVQAKEQI